MEKAWKMRQVLIHIVSCIRNICKYVYNNLFVILSISILSVWRFQLCIEKISLYVELHEKFTIYHYIFYKVILLEVCFFVA